MLTIDARGHRDSDWSSEGEHEMEDHAGDDLSLLDSLDRSRAVVGASMGGMAALWAQGLV